MGGGAITSTNPHQQSSLLPLVNLPVSANSSSTLSFLPNLANNKPLSLGESSTTTRTVQPTDHREGDGDDRAVGSYYDSVFRLVPSRIEVDKAISDLQRFMLGWYGTSEFEGLQKNMLYDLHKPSNSNSNSNSKSNSMLKSLLRFGNTEVDDAFRFLLTDHSVQKMVSSISCDKAVWDAILSNNQVQNHLQHSLSAATEEGLQSSSEKPDLATMIGDWILCIAKGKILELIEQFISLVTTKFQAPDQKKILVGRRLDEKLRSSLLLSVVVLLIVVLIRADGV